MLQAEYDIYDTVIASVAGKHNINWRIWSAARKFGILRRDDVYDQRRARYLYNRYQNTPLVSESIRELFHEKYDIAGTEKIMRQIRDGDISLVWEDVEEFSGLAKPILDHASQQYTNAAKIDPRTVKHCKKQAIQNQAQAGMRPVRHVGVYHGDGGNKKGAHMSAL